MKFADSPLNVFFDLVPTGAALYAPVYDEPGELVDFRCVRLNPAGQRLLGLPAQPPHTLREHCPRSVSLGIFAYYCAAYRTNQAATYDVPEAGDSSQAFSRLIAQRSGELLVVSFTERADLPPAAGEASRGRQVRLPSTQRMLASKPNASGLLKSCSCCPHR